MFMPSSDAGAPILFRMFVARCAYNAVFFKVTRFSTYNTKTGVNGCWVKAMSI